MSGRQKLVIFGDGEAAELAHFYLTHDSDFEVVAFTVDARYLKSAKLCGLPVVAFEQLATLFPPVSHAMLVAIGYSGVNEVRAAKYLQAKEHGYSLISYVSSRASVWPGFQPGDNCFILEGVIIQPFAVVGNDVTLWSGCHIGHHSTIGDHCFVGPAAAISGRVTVGEKSFIGLNASVRDHVSVAPRTVIGAGAVVLADTAPAAVLKGVAAEILPIGSECLRAL